MHFCAKIHWYFKPGDWRFDSRPQKKGNQTADCSWLEILCLDRPISSKSKGGSRPGVDENWWNYSHITSEKGAGRAYNVMQRPKDCESVCAKIGNNSKNYLHDKKFARSQLRLITRAKEEESCVANNIPLHTQESLARLEWKEGRK